MLGWSSWAATSASRMKRARNSWLRDNSAERIFSASRRGKVGFCARYTVPMPPIPSTRSIRYPATTAPTGSTGHPPPSRVALEGFTSSKASASGAKSLHIDGGPPCAGSRVDPSGDLVGDLNGLVARFGAAGTDVDDNVVACGQCMRAGLLRWRPHLMADDVDAVGIGCGCPERHRCRHIMVVERDSSVGALIPLV